MGLKNHWCGSRVVGEVLLGVILRAALLAVRRDASGAGGALGVGGRVAVTRTALSAAGKTVIAVIEGIAVMGWSQTRKLHIGGAPPRG